MVSRTKFHKKANGIPLIDIETNFIFCGRQNNFFRRSLKFLRMIPFYCPCWVLMKYLAFKLKLSNIVWSFPLSLVESRQISLTFSFWYDWAWLCECAAATTAAARAIVAVLFVVVVGFIIDVSLSFCVRMSA